MNRWLLAALVLLVLATSVDAQKRRGRASAHPPAASRAGKAPKGADSSLPLYLPGFDQPAKGAKKTAPAGPKPKAKAPAKGEPPKPADPMKEADQVTAAADHLTEVEKAHLRFLAEHFRVCDLDASGWLSLREVEVTLSLGRAEYRRMDANQDGRLDEAEFSTQSELLLARLGATPASKDAPKPAPEALAEPPVDGRAEPAPAEPESPQPDDQGREESSEERALAVRPSDLLRRYDVDQSAGIDATEIERLFAEAGLVLSPELVVAQMDPDDSGQLENGELIAIAWLVSRHVPEALRPAPPTDDPADRPSPADSGPAGPKKDGALVPTHFALLDPGHDGFIDEADLRALQSPSRLDLRFRALLSAMDQDGDGRLSEAEFRGSMRAAKR